MSKRKRADTTTDAYSDVVQHLENLLEALPADATSTSLRDKSSVPEEDLSSLIAFFNRGYMSQVVQSWAYYSQISEHEPLADVGYKIARVINLCGESVLLIRHGSEMIRDILDHHMKVIYRCLFLNRFAVTVSALNVLQEITVFNKGSHVSDLFSAFDFSLKIIPKLLAADNVGIRKAFLHFYMSFMRNGTFIVRKDLMSQKKCISGWLRNLNEQNEQDIVLQTFDVFTDCILKEPSFMKSTKISFFNDWVVEQITGLLKKDTSDKLVERIVAFLRLLCTDQEWGVMFPDSGWSHVTVKSLHKDKERDSSSVSKSSTDEVNNRLVLHVLKFLKPWDDVHQQTLVVDILTCCSELVSPYVAGLFRTISFDPKLSSFWVSYASFISKICNLPVDETRLLLVEPPSVEVVLNNTLPFRGSSMTKVLQYQTAFVKYLGAQTLLFGIRRLLQVKEVFLKKNWDFEAVLIEAREQRLPSPQVITQLTQTTQDEPQPILKTVNLILVSKYLSLVPPDDLSRGISLSDNWRKHDIDGIETVQIHATLDIQMKSGGLGRWWNKNAGSDYSIFTELLRLGVFNESLASNVRDILVDLCNPTLLFQTETHASPVSALIHSLLPFGDDMKIWKLVDESVARVMRSPYKYVDAFAKIRRSEQATLSPLIVVLLEQLKYVESPSDTVDKWLGKFVRDCCIIGEDWQAANALAVEAGLLHAHVINPDASQEWLNLYPTNEYFDYVTAADNDMLLKRDDLVYKLDSILDLEGTKFRALRSPVNVATHLLDSVARNPNLRGYMGSKNFFVDFLETTKKEYANVYFNCLSIDIDLDELRVYLAQSSSPLMLLSNLSLWVLDNAAIVQLLEEKDITEDLAAEVVRRGIGLSLNIIRKSANANTKTLHLLSKAVTAHSYQELPEESVDDCILYLVEQKCIPLVVALIQASRHAPSSGLDFSHLTRSEAIAVVSAISKYSDNHINLDVMNLDIVQNASVSLETLPLYTYDRLTKQPSLLPVLVEFVNTLTGSSILSADVVNIVGIISRLSPAQEEVTKRLFSQYFLWLTKNFAEESSDNLSESVKSLVSTLYGVLENVNVWDTASKRTLNSWLEASLKWFKLDEVFELASLVVFQAKVGSGLEFSKLLQMITNSDDPLVYSRSAPIIWKLYLFDEKAQVNIESAIIQKIFRGSSDPNDWILLDVLRRIETHTGIAWTNKVISWTFTEGDSPRLVAASRDGYEVVLNPKRIRMNTTQFHCDEYFLPKEQETFTELMSRMKDFKVIYDVPNDDMDHLLSGKCKYNPLFLLLSLVSSDLLATESPDKINVKKFTDVGGLSFVIAALGSVYLREVSKSVLQGLSNVNLRKYRERLVLELIIGKLRTATEEQKEEQQQQISPCMYSILAQMVPVVMNPGNFLYEKACEFLMAGPSIRAGEIPLYRSVRKSDSENSQREIIWLLEVLTNALHTFDDVRLYMKCGVFEWALALPATLFQKQQHQLVKKAEETPQGSISLVKRNAGIAYCSIADEELLKGMLKTAKGFAEWSLA